MEKKTSMYLFCVGWNWSPPNDATQGLIPPVPTAIKKRLRNIPHGDGGVPVNPGMLVTDMSTFPTQYTMDSRRIVQNFPRYPSEMNPPGESGDNDERSSNI